MDLKYNFYIKNGLKMLNEMLFKQGKIKKRIVYEDVKNLTLVSSDEIHLQNDLLFKNGFDFQYREMRRLHNEMKIACTKVERVLRQQKNIVHEVIDILKEESDDSYIVGGFIRDTINNTESKDIDFVTSIPYDKLEEIFSAAGYVVKHTGKHFLVIHIIKGNKTFEIANLRKDGTYMDGRRPESVDIGTIEDDYNRRDFTINALYYRLKEGALIDINGDSLLDINNKELHFIGNAKKRIEEDYLRVMRGYRFINKGYIPDPKTLKNLRTYFEKMLQNTSSTRILNELERIINEKDNVK